MQTDDYGEQFDADVAPKWYIVFLTISTDFVFDTSSSFGVLCFLIHTIK